MRVLHVAECIGGVDRYLRCLLKYSSCESIMILSQLYNKEDYEGLADHVEIMHMTHGMGASALKEAKELRGKIRKHNPDVVYAHSSIAGAITRMACIGLNVKVLYNPHGWSFNMESGKKKIFIILEKLMAHFCDAIICISEAEKVSALIEGICKEDKLRVIENGIDIEGYKKETVSLPIPKDGFVVGMVGRISRQKAPDVFVKMAGEVHKEIKNSFFIIVGDVLEGREEERKEIEQLAKKLGVNLLITGWVNNPMAYMRRFDVACLLSRWEGFGLAIPEYMLAEVPIVATKVDAIPYLIEDGVNGVLVRKDNWHEAAMKIVELANDEDKRKEMVANGLRTVKERFDARRVATIGIALYIYCLQTNAERNKSRSLQTQVKEAIANEIENLWLNVVFNEKPNQSITNEKLKKLFMDYSLELKESLKYEEYLLLTQIVNLLLSEASRSKYIFIFRPWLRDVLKSDYWYLLHRAEDFSLLYDESVFILIKTLKGSSLRYQKEVDTIFDKNKNILFMRDSEGMSIYKGKKLLAKGVFGFDKNNNFRILNGYSTSKVYVGFVRNGLREGNGKWYRGKYTMEEGQFKAGKLIYGIKHNWVLRKYKGRQYIKFPLDSDDARHLYISIMMHTMFINKGSYHVVDIEVKKGKEKYVNHRDFKKYCEDNDVF